MDLKPAQVVFVRLDLNAPIAGGTVGDTTRIDATIPTLQRLLAAGVKIIIGAHLGRPASRQEHKYSLAPVGEVLSARLDKEVVLVDDPMAQPPSSLVPMLPSGAIILLENLRYHPGETAALRHERLAFAGHLSAGVDWYVGDAFGVAHRQHSSVVELPECIGYDRCVAGDQLALEYQMLSGAAAGGTRPVSLVMGGAKIADKLAAIMGLVPVLDHLIIGGAMAMPVLKAMQISTGDHVISRQELRCAELLIRNAAAGGLTIHLPTDHIIAPAFDAHAPATTSAGAAVPPGYLGLDIGPTTRADFKTALTGAQTIIWNGPMGVYEWSAFSAGSAAMAQTIAHHPAHTIVGGGDSLSLLNRTGLAGSISHLSTGGGAMLALFSNPKLPGLKALWA